MLDIGAKYATTPALEREGVVEDLGDGAWVRLGRAVHRNPRFVEAVDAAMAEAGHPDPAELDADADLSIDAAIYARGVCLEWGGLAFDGAPIETAEQLAEAFRAAPDFLDEIKRRARDRERFRAERREGDRGNSSPASTGS